MTKIKGLRMAALALLVLALLLAFHLVHALWSARTFTAPSGGMPGMATPAAFKWPAIEASRWKLFRSGDPEQKKASTGALSDRYRLAGVFLMLSDSGRSGGENRCAILDDLQTQQQILATEDEKFLPEKDAQIGWVRVEKVERDYVILSNGSGEERIDLAAGIHGGSEKRIAVADPNTPIILESNRFGNRIGETRWEFSRAAVLEYYQEMMDDPERLAALFMAMEPNRDEAGKVAGYRVNMEVGEKEFYTQMGFQQGDVVRKVNSMRMTSQRRAEYFIGEFVQSRLGAVVIDIERNGESKKLVYLIK